MKKASLTFSWDLWVDCPRCSEVFDASGQDDDGWLSRPLLNNDWDALIGGEITCDACGEDFEIGGIEY